jgi:hypothetical protein
VATGRKDDSHKCYIKVIAMVRLLPIMKDTQLQAQWPPEMLETCSSDEHDVSGEDFANLSSIHE